MRRENGDGFPDMRVIIKIVEAYSMFKYDLSGSIVAVYTENNNPLQKSRT